MTMNTKNHRVWLKEPSGRLVCKEFASFFEARDFYVATDNAIALYAYNKDAHCVQLVNSKLVRE